MILFVDVDDTLVIWQKAINAPQPDGFYMETPWAANERLIVGVKAFHEANPRMLIVIWSGGGKEYAEMWARRLDLNHLSIGMLKDKMAYELISEGDIVIDDEDLGGHRTHKPDEWPEEQHDVRMDGTDV